MGLPRRQIHRWPRSGTGGDGGWAGPDPAPRRLRLLVRPVLRHNGAVDGAGGLDVVGWPVVAASLSLVALALALGWALGLRIGRDVVVAVVRAAAQLLAVGAVLALIFESAAAGWLAVAWVAVMVGVATGVVRRRARHRIAWLTPVTGAVVLASAAVSLAVTFGLGVLPYEPASVVVVAGITIGNAVPSAVLAVDQAVGLCRDRVGEIEAALALGLSRRQIVRFVAPRAARSALIPQVERTKVVGLIALPGAMTGLLLAGVDPVDAVVIQILVMYLVLGTAAICVVALVGTVAVAATDGRGGAARWARAGAGVHEPAVARR